MSTPGDEARPESHALGDPSMAEWVAELADRLAAGEAVDLEAYARAHPERAEAVRLYQPAIEMMADLGRAVARREVPPHRDDVPRRRADVVPELGTLGDFRLIREVGRGGMGIVYEAEQLSLRRRVALKVLPFSTSMDPRRLRRFQIEAQAAALLHHTHIVPVHAIGAERGVPFYAMQFIDGRTLADVIVELRALATAGRPHRPASRGISGTTELMGSGPPGSSIEVGGPSADSGPREEPTGDPCEDIPAVAASNASGSSDGRSHHDRAHVRTAVTLALQAAEALEHAHENGVIHRDIKPANLMVDTRGHVWVTDFGLARLVAAAELTRTGDLMGTLRYMSPEQARGSGIGVVDHRTDIYSLGAALYELLTLVPAVCGADRQQILHGIESAEPRPLRRLNPSIPADLETVVLKALAKEPERRYPTAREFAEDLRRLLEDKPIRARPPALLERLERWCRRHRATVEVAAAALVLATVGLGTGLAIVAHERDESRRQARRAEEHFGRVLDVVDNLLTRVSEERLLNEPGFQRVRRDLLTTAVSYLRGLASGSGDDPQIRTRLAAALVRVADLSQQIGANDEALAAGRDAVSIYEGLVKGHPRVSDYQLELARARLHLGALLRMRGDIAEAESLVREATTVCQKLVVAQPRAEGRQLLLAECHNGLSTLSRDLGDFQTARSSAAQVAQVWVGLTATHPAVAEYQANLAAASMGLGLLQYEEGDHVGGDRSFAAAIRGFERLVEDHGQVAAYRCGLAFACFNFAKLRRHTAPADAEKLARRAVALCTELVAANGDVVQYRDALARAFLALALVRQAAGAPEPALKAYQESIAVQEGLVRESPGQSPFWVRLGETHARLGDFLLARGEPPAAYAHYREALSVYQRGLARLPDDPEIGNALARYLIECPDPQVRSPGQAIDHCRKAVARAPKAGRFWQTLGLAYYYADHHAEAAESLERAFALRPGADAEAGLVLALSYTRLQRADRARLWYEKAEGWAEASRERDDRIERLRKEAAAQVHPSL